MRRSIYRLPHTRPHGKTVWRPDYNEDVYYQFSGNAKTVVRFVGGFSLPPLKFRVFRKLVGNYQIWNNALRILKGKINMARVFIFLCVTIFVSPDLYAAQSSITEAEGKACMGEDKSRRQTREEAFNYAKRNALESVMVYVSTETKTNNFELEKDIINAYSKAKVKILEKKELEWYQDEFAGKCLRVWIKTEVIPDEKEMKKLGDNEEMANSPSTPLNAKIWTEKKEYKKGEKIKIYIKGNKPFYARVVYKDVNGDMTQLLPNPYREKNYFNGGAIYEIPSGNDKFELAVFPPFGNERIMVYASTLPLGNIDLSSGGGVYIIKTKPEDIGDMTRGILIKGKNSSSSEEKTTAEFSEVSVNLKTGL